MQQMNLDGVFVTFTGPAVWDKEAGHSPWEGKADCKPGMLSTPSSEALTPNRAGWPNCFGTSLVPSLICPFSLKGRGEAAPRNHHAWVQLCHAYCARWDSGCQATPVHPAGAQTSLTSRP